jgi:hypothetical protein
MVLNFSSRSAVCHDLSLLDVNANPLGHYMEMDYYILDDLVRAWNLLFVDSGGVHHEDREASKAGSSFLSQYIALHLEFSGSCVLAGVRQLGALDHTYQEMGPLKHILPFEQLDQHMRNMNR